MSLLRKKCQLCKRRSSGIAGDRLQKTKRYNSYEWRTYRWHNSCLQRILNNPETHGHTLVDLALDITDCIASGDERKFREKRRKERLDKAKVRHPSFFEEL